MPYKRNSSPFWWTSYENADGKRVRQSLGTSNRKEADALEAKWKLEAYQAVVFDEQPDRDFDDLMLDYLTANIGTKRSYERDVRIVKILRKEFGGKAMSEIGAKEVWDYQIKRKNDGVKPATVNRELAFLRSAINFANTHWEWDLKNPVVGRMVSDPDGERDRWLKPVEAKRLLKEAKKSKASHLHDFIQLALNTGARSGELKHLEWSRVDLTANEIYLDAIHTKTARPRVVPLNQDARKALIGRMKFRAEHCPATPYVFVNEKGQRIASIKKSFRTACNRAGIYDFRIHDLRHTFASWLVRKGVTLFEVSRLLGHTTVKMTERYAHLEPRESTVRMLDSQDSGHTEVILPSDDNLRRVVSH